MVHHGLIVKYKNMRLIMKKKSVLNSLSQLIDVDKEKCVNCHACISACPVKYCNDGSGEIVSVDSEMCIACGECLVACTHGARRYKDDTNAMFDALDAGEKIVAIVAPAVVANFPGQYMNINGWLKSSGVEKIFDVSFGAELCVKSYIELLRKNDSKTIIAQPCPAIVSYIEIYQPELLPYLAVADSPQLHTMKMIEKYYPDLANHKIAIISPCLAKKREYEATGYGDFNVGFRSLDTYIKEHNIDLNKYEPSDYDNPDAERAVLFSSPGGLLETVQRWLPDIDFKIRKIEGPHIYEYLRTLPEVIKEGMSPVLIDCLNCNLGCNGGPLTMAKEIPQEIVEHWIDERARKMRKQYKQSALAANKDSAKMIEDILQDYWSEGLYNRVYSDISENNYMAIPTEQEYEEIYHQMYKFDEKDMYNCTSCGYLSCKSMAKAIFNGKNKAGNCHFYLALETENSHRSILQKERQLKNIIETCIEGFVELDINQQIIKCNPAICDMLKINWEKMTKMKVNELTDDKGKKELEKYLNNDNYKNAFELDLFASDGSLVSVLASFCPTYDENEKCGFFAFFTNITERKKWEQQLLELNEELEERVQKRTSELQNRKKKFQAIFDQTVDLMAILDVDGNVLEANQAAIDMVQTQEDEFLNVPFWETKWWNSSPEHQRQIRDAIKKAATGELVHFESSLTTPDGNEHLINISLTPVTGDDGKVMFLLPMAHDVTELKKAVEIAETATMTKSTFLANMSHEIRTPMNAIIGLSHLCLNSNMDKRQHDYVEKVYNAAKSLLGIINDILDFSKIEAGKLEMEKIPFQLDDVLDNLGSLMAVKAQEKNIEVLFDAQPDVPRGLIGDPLRLGQVLLNLVSNAEKFTEKGEIIVKTNLLKITDDYVELEFKVKDSGIGMTAEQCEKLFKSFSQVDTSTTRKYGGTGLGLAISKQLVEMMQGNIRVESEVNKGTVFSFNARFGRSKVIEEITPLLAQADLKGLKVLVVDDIESTREMMQVTLDSFSFRTSCVESGVKAIEAMTSAPDDDPFKLILMDWKMPGMDGIEATAKIKQLTGETPPMVIMITSYGREEIMNKIEKASLDGFLIKPFTPSTLLDAIMGIFGSKNSLPLLKKGDNKWNIAPPEEIRGAKILLVEDNEINQQVARELLEEAGITITIANNGLEAVEWIEKEKFDLILMDLQMPEMDGFEATGIIRQNSKNSDLPILAMTANALAEDRNRCLEAGMNDHIPKPIDPNKLYNTLVKWLPEISKVHQSNANVNVKVCSDMSLPKSLPGIKIETGLHSLRGNKVLYMKLLKDFVTDHSDDVQKIVKAIENKDFEQAQRIAHTLKGIAGTIGAQKLFAFAKTTESAAANKTPDDLMAAIDKLSPALLTVINGLQVLNSKEELSSVAANPDALMPMLQELEELLNDMDPNSEEKAQAICEAFASSEYADKTKQILQQAADFEFDEAVKLVHELEIFLENDK